MGDDTTALWILAGLGLWVMLLLLHLGWMVFSDWRTARAQKCSQHSQNDTP
jgi:Tfp pilus assembly protein PilN